MNAAKKKPNAIRNERRAVVSAQQTIPYVAMHPDGICQLPGGLYTKTVEYEDINYAVASTEDQTAIFGGWSSFLNYFDSSLPFQLSFVNRRSRSGSKYRVNIPERHDAFDSIRNEFTAMLKNQIARSNNGIERAKYITFGIPAESIAAARPRLERVEADIIGNFKRLGVPCETLSGRQRLAVLHSQMHPGRADSFRFSWKDIVETGIPYELWVNNNEQLGFRNHSLSIFVQTPNELFSGGSSDEVRQARQREWNTRMGIYSSAPATDEDLAAACDRATQLAADMGLGEWIFSARQLDETNTPGGGWQIELEGQS